MEVIVKETSDVQIPTKPLLSYAQREQTKQEISEIDSALNPMNPWRMKSQGDVAQSVKRAKRLKDQLKEASPPELDGRAKDKLVKKIEALEAEITQGMPTQEEMRKNPAGMVGRHMKWERLNKRKIMAWKNARKMLEPASEDKDLSNVEILRPVGEMDRFRGNAQISGHMSYGNIPEWVWERIFDKAPNSALNQVKAREDQTTGVNQSVTEPKVDKRTLPRTEEQKRVLAERLALARAKQAETKDPVSPQEGESVPFEGA